MSLVLQDQLVLSPATADHLQGEIDTIKAGSDVTDVVGTYENLENYDTSKLTDNDIIKVLQDETQDNAQTYYRWSTSSREFTYVGKVESKTYTAGNGIDITNDTISVTAPTLVNDTPTKQSTIVITKGTTDTSLIWGSSTIVGVNAKGGAQTGQTIIGASAKSDWADSVAIGSRVNNTGYDGSVAIGCNAYTGPKTGTTSLQAATSIGSYSAAKGTNSVAVGRYAQIDGHRSIQLGRGSNSGDDKFFVGSHELLDLSNGTIPEARLADTTNATQGQVLQLDSNNNAIWADVDGLPDQAGQTGKVLTTDGFVPGWVAPTTITFRTWEANE